MDRAWLNRIGKLDRINPVEFLKGFAPLAVGADPKVDGLRAGAQKENRERFEACLFCYGLSCKMGRPVWVVDDREDGDYDFVAVSQDDNGDYRFTRIQLKEVIQKHLNPQASLQSTIDGLVRYSGDLTVAIRVNQMTEVDLDKITTSHLSIKALWIYGAASQDASRWLIVGNLMEPSPNLSWTFDYPK